MMSPNQENIFHLHALQAYFLILHLANAFQNTSWILNIIHFHFPFNFLIVVLCYFMRSCIYYFASDPFCLSVSVCSFLCTLLVVGRLEGGGDPLWPNEEKVPRMQCHPTSCQPPDVRTQTALNYSILHSFGRHLCKYSNQRYDQIRPLVILIQTLL